MSWTDDVMSKLEKLIPRLASDQDAEIVSTIRAIDRILRKNELDWHDFTARSLMQTSGNYKSKNDKKSSYQGRKSDNVWAEKVSFCLNSKTAFKPRETEFLHDISARLRHIHELTPRQAAWLDALHSRAVREHEDHKNYDPT